MWAERVNRTRERKEKRGERNSLTLLLFDNFSLQLCEEKWSFKVQCKVWKWIREDGNGNFSFASAASPSCKAKRKKKHLLLFLISKETFKDVHILLFLHMLSLLRSEPTPCQISHPFPLSAVALLLSCRFSASMYSKHIVSVELTIVTTTRLSADFILYNPFNPI